MILLELAWRFALVSAIAFGGTTAMLPEMHRFLVQDNHWMSDSTFTTLFAISQAAPGPAVLVVTLFGWQVGGLPGAAVSTLAMSIPSSAMALLFEHYTAAHRDSRSMIVIRHALAPLTIGLLIATGFVLARGADRSTAAVLLTVLTIAVTLRTKWNPLWLIAGGAALGMLAALA